MKQFRLYFAALFAILLVACSKTSLLGSLGGSVGGGSATVDGGVTPDDAGSTNEVPAGTSLPVSFLTGVNSSLTVSFAGDTGQTNPVILYPGAVDSAYTTSGNYEVAVSTSEIESTATSTAHNRGFELISSAYADTTFSQCSNPNTTCCSIERDGSAQCYLTLTDSTPTQLYVAVIDATGNVSPSNTETVQSNALWLAAAPSDTKVVEGNLYNITNEIAVKTDYNSTTSAWNVSGDHTTSYENFAMSGSKLDYDTDNALFGALNTADGINLYDHNGTYVATTTVAEATAYTTFKYTDDNLYFGIEQTSADNAYIYHALDGLFPFDPHDGRYLNDAIQFIQTGDMDYTGNNQLNHTKTLAFDVNSSGYAFVIYLDGNGYPRFRMSDGTTRFGGTRIVRSSFTDYDFRDVQFLHESDTINRVLIVDHANNTIWSVTPNIARLTLSSNLDATTQAITVGAGPVSLVFNTDKTRAYVLNENSATISVLSIAGDSSLPTVVATVDLSDSLSGKTVTLTPTTMTYTNGYLLVGCEGLKGNIVVNTATIQETE